MSSKSKTHEGERGESWREAAARLGVSEATLRRLAAAGQLRVVHIGTRAIIPSSEIDRLLSTGAKVA